MSELGIFVFGVVIFAGYMFGLLSMINKQHKIQAKQWPGEKDETQKKNGSSMDQDD